MQPRFQSCCTSNWCTPSGEERLEESINNLIKKFFEAKMNGELYQHLGLVLV